MEVKNLRFMKTLELNQMEVISGGVAEAEYCAELQMIIENGGGVPGVSEFFWAYHNCDYWTM